MALFGLGIEALAILPAAVMIGPFARIEIHGVEIGKRHAPAFRRQAAAGDLGQMSVEGAALGMGENDMSLHECCRSDAQISLPGLRMPLGSSACFNRRMTASSASLREWPR